MLVRSSQIGGIDRLHQENRKMEITCCLSIPQVNIQRILHLSLPCIFAENVESFFGAWIIGDNFLDDYCNTLESMITEANENRKLLQPYMNEYYNIKRFTDPVCVDRSVACIVNLLIDGLNQRHKLPCFLIVIINTDIIADFNIFKSNIIKSVQQTTEWLVKQINIQVRRKRLELIALKPGTIYRNDPSIIFVRMIQHANLNLHRGSYLDELYTLQPKFNDALNDAVARIDQHILTINSCNTSSHFTHKGKLSTKGKSDFWLEINDLLHCFNCKEVKLLPNPNNKFVNPKKRQFTDF